MDITEDIIIRMYDTDADAPVYGGSSFNGGDEYLRIITSHPAAKRVCIDVLNDRLTPEAKKRITEKRVVETIVRRGKIPTIEQHLEDMNMFGNIASPIIRPSVELTRGDLNTMNGREKIFQWLCKPTKQYALASMSNIYYSTVYNDCNHWHQYMPPMAAMIKNGCVPEWFEQDKGAMIVDGVDVKPYVFMLTSEWQQFSMRNGLFEYEESTSSHVFPTYWTFNSDLFMEMAKGAPLDGREEFEQMCRTSFPNRFINPMMERYDIMQKYLDGLFATYLLFKTENFASVEHLPAWQQHVALRNYFSTFKYYTQTDRLPDEQLPIIDKKSKTRYTRKDGYKYEGVAYTGRLKYIVSELMEDVLHAPANLRPYANGQKEINPAAHEKKTAIPVVKITSSQKAQPREPNDSIALYTLQHRANTLFDSMAGSREDKNRMLQEINEFGFSEEQIFAVCRPTRDQQKFHDYMMWKIQESPDFNHVEWGREVSAALNAENRDEALLNISNKFACTIDLKDCAEYVCNRGKTSRVHKDELSIVAGMLFREDDQPILLKGAASKQMHAFKGRKFTFIASTATFTIEGQSAPRADGEYDVRKNSDGTYYFATGRIENLKIRVVYSPLLFYGMDRQYTPRTPIFYEHTRGLMDKWGRVTIKVLEAYKVQAFRTAKHELLKGHKGKHGKFNQRELNAVEQSKQKSVVPIMDFVDAVFANVPIKIPENLSNTQRSRYIQYIENELTQLATLCIDITKFERNNSAKYYIFYWKQDEQPAKDAKIVEE